VAERRGRDSNPRTDSSVSGFQDRPVRPLRHPASAHCGNRPICRLQATDFSAKQILSSGSVGLFVCATALAVWDLTIGVSAIMSALNRIRDVAEKRSLTRRILTAVALAVEACVIGAIFVVTVAPIELPRRG
jgi:hypothetical protein